MDDPELMVGPVAEALGVTRTWLLSSDDPLPEHIDLPVSLLVELMDAADCLYPTEEQRWRQIRQWLSRLTGRSAAEFERAAPLMLAVRRQFRLSRDEDLQAVTVWRRAQPRPAEMSQLQLTVRPENGARLRRLVEQLGSEEAAIDFLLQMDDNCGKGASLRRTRWPPKVHYEASRGQVKIDVGTEMVCVVLSQFKPAAAPAPAVAAEPQQVVTPPAPQAVLEVVAAPEAPVVNGHEPTPSAPAADGAPPALSLTSAYQTVVRDATLPAQMFADDDLAADQLSEVQQQLTQVLDQLADESSQMADMSQQMAHMSEQMAAGAGEEAGLPQQQVTPDPLAAADDQVASADEPLQEEECAQVAAEGAELAVSASPAVTEEVADMGEMPAEVTEVVGEAAEPADEMADQPADEMADEPADDMADETADDMANETADEMADEAAGVTEAAGQATEAGDEMAEVSGEVVVEEPYQEAEMAEAAGEAAQVTDVTELPAEQVEALVDDVEPLVELPDQLLAPAAGPSGSPAPAVDEPMELGEEVLELAGDEVLEEDEDEDEVSSAAETAD